MKIRNRFESSYIRPPSFWNAPCSKSDAIGGNPLRWPSPLAEDTGVGYAWPNVGHPMPFSAFLYYLYIQREGVSTYGQIKKRFLVSIKRKIERQRTTHLNISEKHGLTPYPQGPPAKALKSTECVNQQTNMDACWKIVWDRFPVSIELHASIMGILKAIWKIAR